MHNVNIRGKKRISMAAAVLLLVVASLNWLMPGFAVASNRSVLADFVQVEYDYARGLSTKSINAVLQTADGYLWIGGYTGLIRYSGTKFVKMEIAGEEDNNVANIMTLFEDSRHRLWIGTNSDSVLCFENYGFTRVAQERALSITGFAEKKDGTVLFGSKEGLFAAGEDGGYQVIDESLSIGNMLLDAREELWLTDLYGVLSPPEAAAGLVDLSLAYSCLYEDLAGNIWLGTEDGTVVVLERVGDSFQKGSVISTGLHMVRDFSTDSQGNVWVAADTGLGRIDENRNFQPVEGAKINTALTDIFTDYEGNIWVASSRSGLVQFIPSAIRDYSFLGDLGDRVTNSALEYRNQVYIATDEGLYILDENDMPVKNELTELLTGIRIRSLTEDSKGNLWISAFSVYGAVRYAPDGTVTVFNMEKGLSSDRARMIAETNTGKIVVGTANGLNIIQGDEVIETYGVADGLVNSIVLCTEEGSDGQLYIGTDGGGIFVLENGKISPLEIGEMDSKAILRLYYDAEGVLWIATGTSFYTYDGTLEKLSHIAKTVGAVFDIIPTLEGEICLLATNGLICGSPKSLRENGEDWAVLLNHGGKPFPITANSWNRMDAEGRLFICGTSEVGRFSIENLFQQSYPVRLLIDKIVVDDELIPAADKTVYLNQDAKRFSIHAVSPHFGFEEHIQLEYYLEGFDATPRYANAKEEKEITYTNLRGGTHVFKIRAQNEAGDYFAEREIILEKEYRWYEYPAAWVCMGLALIVLIAVVIRLVVVRRTYKILQKQQEYKKITDQAILTISNAVDAKDQYTEGHSERVAGYSVEVARRLGLSAEEQEHIFYIALLHDIGKIGIPDHILNKPERLTDEEFSTMKSHTNIGGDILRDFEMLENIAEGAQAHHEKYDGSGYPNGLKGEEISKTARIIGVCDTYDAMATTRAYRVGLDKDYIVEEIKRCSGTQFDPEIAKVMVDMVQEGFMLDMENRMKDKMRGKE